ncbi:hypothetical protein [Teichococcus aestuarii]|nr:hypothetical protein [Pseudoroseomonas aestuarii]
MLDGRPTIPSAITTGVMARAGRDFVTCGSDMRRLVAGAAEAIRRCGAAA